MKIYNIEKQLKLDELITASVSNVIHIALETQVMAPSNQTLVQAGINPKTMSESEKAYHLAGLTKDVMLVRGILASTNWNKNDDVFTAADTWKARYTARNKPVNMEHMGRESTGNKNFGVIVDCYACDDEMNYIYDQSEDFNIAMSAILWERYFPLACEEVKAGIENNTKFISMECMIDDFGYALKADDDADEIMLMPRHDITAWMTQHLRIFGGEGTVAIGAKNYKIGRWLRDITFTGAGVVANPANDKSVFAPGFVSHKEDKKQKFVKLANFVDASVLNNTEDKGNYSLWPI